jgi:streptogramin lyase
VQVQLSYILVVCCNNLNGRVLKMGLLDRKSVGSLLLIILILVISAYPGSTLVSQSTVVTPVSALHPAANATSSYTLDEWNVPTSHAGPWGITTDQQGGIWFTENRTSKLARFDPTNNYFTEWSIPGGGNPRYILTRPVAIGGSNATRVYFTEYSSNKVGYFDSWNGTFREWQLTSGSNPVGIYVDANYTIWFTESGRDTIGRLSPTANLLTEWTLPGATSSPPTLTPWGIYVQSALSGVYHNVTDRYVWFTELTNNTIGRLQVTNSLLILWNLNSLGFIPGLNYGPMDITVDSSSNVIFSASSGDRISVLQNCGTTCIGYREYVLPSRTVNAKPTSVNFDARRSVAWFTEYNTGIVAFADTTLLGSQGLVPKSSPCVIPPSAGPPVCASPSGYTTKTLTPTITKNVTGVPGSGIRQTPVTLPIYQGPINAITEYKLPNATAQPNFVTVDSRGGVWFTESNLAVNRIGHLSVPYVFAISVSPSSQNVNRTQSAAFHIGVGLTSGYPLPVQLSVNNPTNISASFSPPVGTPPFSSILTLTPSNSTTPNTYTMTLTATSGGQSQTSQISLTVNSPPPPPAFDYAIDVTNGTVTIQQGEQATYQFQTTVVTSAPSQLVSLTIDESRLPSGTTVVQFTNTSGNPPFTSTLVLQTNATTPGGTYDLTNSIIGVSSGLAPHHPQEPTVLIVTEIPRDFYLSTSSNTTNLVQASRVDLTLTVTSIGPFTGNVSLSGEFTPSQPELSITFSPSTLSPNGGIAQTTMEIIASRNTPGATYQLTITGASDVPSISHQITIFVHVSPCLIATATFGSELAPEVQFLQDFRDRQILHTFAGSNFMYVFNSWYYSFSPTIAQYVSRNTIVRGTVKAMLYPLMGILHLASFSYSALEFQPEVGVLAAGILASYMIGLIYLGLPMLGLYTICGKRAVRTRRLSKSLVLLLSSLLAAYCVSEVLGAGAMMMIVSAGIVLTFLVAGGLLPIMLFADLRRRMR